MGINVDELTQEIEELEKKLGIPEHFFDQLLKEDDWSFIIKAHALVESAVTHLLVSFFSVTELEDVFARLELGNASYGKIIIAKKLKLLTEEERRFVQALSELRNKIVDNVRNVNFDFKNYIPSLGKNQKQKFVHAFGYSYLVEVNGVKEVTMQDAVINEPKSTIWRGLQFVLAVISLKSGTFELERSIQSRKNALLEKMHNKS